MPRPSRISFELLETFVSLVENDGDASKAATALGINQPSMSKRLSQLQNVGPWIRSPWVDRRGKTWRQTTEGKRMLPAVRSLIRQYRAIGAFSGGGRLGAPKVSFGCGQQAATSYVLDALRRFLAEAPEVRLRVATMRGRSRIEGVANGLLDLATVSTDEAEIRAVARRSLHVETLRDDRLVLVAGRSSQALWKDDFDRLPEQPAGADVLTRFPLILPEPDAGIRRQVDRDLESAGVADRLKVVMEVGGWSTILAYVREGLGVGIVSEAAISGQDDRIATRPLDPDRFRPIPLSLICRKSIQAPDRLDLSDDADRLRRHLIDAVRGGS